jgi:hypothetical protein
LVNALVQDVPGVAPFLSDEVLALPGHDTVDDEEMFHGLGLGVDGLEVNDGIAGCVFPTQEFFHYFRGWLVMEFLMVAIPEGHGISMEECVVSVPFKFCHILP